MKSIAFICQNESARIDINLDTATVATFPALITAMLDMAIRHQAALKKLAIVLTAEIVLIAAASPEKKPQRSTDNMLKIRRNAKW